METTHDLSKPPVLVHQPGQRSFAPLVGCVVFVVSGLLMRSSGYEVSGTVAAVGFTLIGLQIAAKTFRPPLLVLGPEGLVHRTPYRTRRWKWPELGAFEVVEGESRSIMVTPSAGPAARIPDGWDMPLDQLGDSLNAARVRWG
jgi:hypothetical protein